MLLCVLLCCYCVLCVGILCCVLLLCVACCYCVLLFVVSAARVWSVCVLLCVVSVHQSAIELSLRERRIVSVFWFARRVFASCASGLQFDPLCGFFCHVL